MAELRDIGEAKKIRRRRRAPSGFNVVLQPLVIQGVYFLVVLDKKSFNQLHLTEPVECWIPSEAFGSIEEE